MKIIKYFKAENLSRFIKEYGIILNLFISVLALGISGYVLIQSQGGGGQALGVNGTPVKSSTKLLSVLPKDLYFVGNPKAKVTVVEFADFQCPFCHKYFVDIYPKMKSDYIDTGKIKFVYADLAFLGEESIQAARASRCAGEQGKFWEYHDTLYEKQGSENGGAFSDDNLIKFGKNLGLDQSLFNICFSSDKYNKEISDLKNMVGEYGITGTPTTLINGKILKGAVPYQNIVQIIEEGLK